LILFGKLLIEHKYRIRFTKPVLANEFIQFYNIFNSRKLNNKIELGLNLPKIKIKKSTSSEYILDKSSRENALDNVMEGQKQMEAYYQKVKNNKWFILKIFAVLFVFALIFILIM